MLKKTAHKLKKCVLFFEFTYHNAKKIAIMMNRINRIVSITDKNFFKIAIRKPTTKMNRPNSIKLSIRLNIPVNKENI